MTGWVTIGLMIHGISFLCLLLLAKTSVLSEAQPEPRGQVAPLPAP